MTMDAVVLHGSLDQSFSPHFRNPRKIQQYPLISRPFEHFAATQPPLLPLPATSLRRSATMYPPVTKKPGNGSRTRESSLTPKKSKHARKEEKKYSPKKPINVPDRKVLPAKVLPFEGDVFSGSAAFTISPPPSSLPLPTFSLRPKLINCKVEAVAAGIDAGATDDLRRLLRLL